MEGAHPIKVHLPLSGAYGYGDRMLQMLKNLFSGPSPCVRCGERRGIPHGYESSRGIRLYCSTECAEAEGMVESYL